MPANYVLLERVEVGEAGASSITFNSIPQTGYTDLKIVVSARSNISAYRSTLVAQFNGDTGSTYSYRRLYATGSTAGSDATDPTTYIVCGEVVGASSTASTFTNTEVYIPNYLSSNQKSVSTDAALETNDATNNRVSLTAAKWTGTAAISSIKMFDSSTSNSFVQYSTFSLYGLAAVGTTPTKAPKATGGSIIQTDGTYWYHAFLASGTFTPAVGLSCDVLVVAGGGGGGGYRAGGGGAGGYRTSTGLSLSTATTVTVGGGGAGATSSSTAPISGVDSTLSTITSTGGGRGGSYSPAFSPATGGSGGGGAITQTGAAGNTPSTSPAQGFAGGTGPAGGAVDPGAGGGGAGAVGGNGTFNTGPAGAGGIGSFTAISGGATTAVGVLSGGNYYFAGGGGGGAGGTATQAAGGLGGGGIGGAASKSAGNGIANAGAGGGGAGDTAGYTVGGNGGSGIVIIRYAV